VVIGGRGGVSGIMTKRYKQVKKGVTTGKAKGKNQKVGNYLWVVGRSRKGKRCSDGKILLYESSKKN